MLGLYHLFRGKTACGGDDEIAKTWVGLIRSFVEQCPPPADSKPNIYWEGLTGGCRLRGSWPLTFHVLVNSDAVTANDIVLFLKSLVEQCEFIRRTHWEAGNKLNFAMVGLYSIGTVFPELKLAGEWREYALTTALKDINTGYLPDGMGVELSPGYHTLFYNYLTMVDMARGAGRGDEAMTLQLAAGCERLFSIYTTLALPDRQLPCYQDGSSPNVQERLKFALQHYPGNDLFQWFASDGVTGSPPSFRSVALPYAGYIAMRTGWERDAVYLGFDVGPIGYGHAHQDKLNLVLWAFDRMLLMDPGHGDYNAGEFSSCRMEAGRMYDAVLSYAHSGGEAFFNLYWAYDECPAEAVPESALTHSPNEAEAELLSLQHQTGCGRHAISFRVVQAPIPASSPTQPIHFPVMQFVRAPGIEVLRRGPSPDVPYFRKRYLLPSPPETSRDHFFRETIDAAGLPPAFRGHNHSPALDVLPNGDLLMVIYTSWDEYESEASLIAARLRFGNNQWDMPSRFVDMPGANDHAPLLWTDRGVTRLSKETVKWLKAHPNCFEFTFTPKHGSWLNLVETFFSKMTRSFLRFVRVKSKQELKQRIEQYLAQVNEDPVVFRWTYRLDEIHV